MHPLEPIAVRCPPGRDALRWLMARSDHHPAVVVLNPPACTRLEIHEIAEAALENMGHDKDLMAATRSAESLAYAWLRARNITDALFADAPVHPVDRARRTIDWLQQCGVRTWLCIARDDPSDARSNGMEDLVIGLGGRVAPFAELQNRYPNTTRRRTAAAESRFPSVPFVDGVVFRPTCREALDPDHFAVVDARYMATLQSVYQQLADSTDRQRTRAAEGILRRTLDMSGDLDELLIDIRAAQMAALRHGFNVRVSTPLVIGADATIPRTGQLDKQNAWATLERYRDPDVAAVAAMYLQNIAPEAFPGIAIADATINPDGTVTLTAPTGPVTFTEPQATAMRALVYYRRLTTDSGNGTLFHTHRAEQIRPSQVAALLTAPATEVGVTIAPTPIRTSGLDDRSWLARHGIEVVLVTRSDAKNLKSRTRKAASR